MFEKIWEALKRLFPAGEMSEVDLTTKLNATNIGRNLNWRESVVDFLNLIGVDSSRENREALAKELGVPGVSGEASHNEALRKALFKKIKENGGNIPDSLLD